MYLRRLIEFYPNESQMTGFSSRGLFYGVDLDRVTSDIRCFLKIISFRPS